MHGKYSCVYTIAALTISAFCLLLSLLLYPCLTSNTAPFSASATPGPTSVASEAVRASIFAAAIRWECIFLRPPLLPHCFAAVAVIVAACAPAPPAAPPPAHRTPFALHSSQRFNALRSYPCASDEYTTMRPGSRPVARSRLYRHLARIMSTLEIVCVAEPT